MECPHVLVVNTGDLNTISELFHDTVHLDRIISEPTKHVLHIKCKYYKADVALHETDREQDLQKAEGVIVWFDGRQFASWQTALRWMSAASEVGLPLRLLICRTLSPTALFGPSGDVKSVYQSVIENQFELIELEPDEESVEEGEEYGVDRIKSALEAHMWPNLEMHDSAMEGKPTNPRGLSLPANSSTVVTNGGDAQIQESEDLKLDETFESFERLCQNLREARTKMSGLDTKARHKLAEKMTLQFWRAVGGSDDEIDGLSSDGSGSEKEADSAEGVSVKIDNPEVDKKQTNAESAVKTS
ncbi:unnamed protein product [Calicophoron daubneyi]|uniref:Alpha-and gamma-adaptin-binding protein p34 n=1 Tax=Calicophoron daubneyi TaxID=300641 RepID=A0AAV2T9J7_CALDB